MEWNGKIWNGTERNGNDRNVVVRAGIKVSSSV